MKLHREKIYSCNLGVDSRGRLDLSISSLLTKLSQVLSPWTKVKFRPKHAKLCVFLIFLIFTCVLDVIDLMACLRSSVGISVFPNC